MEHLPWEDWFVRGPSEPAAERANGPAATTDIITSVDSKKAAATGDSYSDQPDGVAIAACSTTAGNFDSGQPERVAEQDSERDPEEESQPHDQTKEKALTPDFQSGVSPPRREKPFKRLARFRVPRHRLESRCYRNQ